MYGLTGSYGTTAPQDSSVIGRRNDLVSLLMNLKSSKLGTKVSEATLKAQEDATKAYDQAVSRYKSELDKYSTDVVKWGQWEPYNALNKTSTWYQGGPAGRAVSSDGVFNVTISGRDAIGRPIYNWETIKAFTPQERAWYNGWEAPPQSAPVHPGAAPSFQFDSTKLNIPGSQTLEKWQQTQQLYNMLPQR